MSAHQELMDNLIMKLRNPVSCSKLSQWRNTVLVAVLSGLLYGCSTPVAVKVNKDEATPSKPIIAETDVITSEVRSNYETAMAHIKAEEYDKGIEILSKVVKAVPNTPVPSINLALAYEKVDKMKPAEESLKQALNADPDHPVANNELALLYRKTGRFAEARQLYEKILDKYPNFRIVNKNLGILCDLYTKDYECALKHYVIYSNVVQDDKTVKIWIADIQKRSGR